MGIHRVTSLCEQDIAGLDFSFEIFAVVATPYQHLTTDQTIRTTPVSPYRKAFEFDGDELSDASGDDKAIFTLTKHAQICGYAFAYKGWNNMVFLEYIGLDVNVRGQGNARLLWDAVADWAREIGTSGVRIEAQSNNVAACRFYKSIGLVFGGYDELIYKGIPEHQHETALFWYCIF